MASGMSQEQTFVYGYQADRLGVDLDVLDWAELSDEARAEYRSYDFRWFASLTTEPPVVGVEVLARDSSGASVVSDKNKEDLAVLLGMVKRVCGAQDPDYKTAFDGTPEVIEVWYD